MAQTGDPARKGRLPGICPKLGLPWGPLSQRAAGTCPIPRRWLTSSLPGVKKEDLFGSCLQKRWRTLFAQSTGHAHPSRPPRVYKTNQISQVMTLQVGTAKRLHLESGSGLRVTLCPGVRACPALFSLFFLSTQVPKSLRQRENHNRPIFFHIAKGY